MQLVIPHSVHSFLSNPWDQPQIASESTEFQPTDSTLSFILLLIDDPHTALYLLPFAVQTFVTTLTCITDMLSWPLSTAQKWALASLYLPYWLLGGFSSFPPPFCSFVLLENEKTKVLERKGEQNTGAN